MIIVMKPGAKKSSISHVIDKIKSAKLRPVPLYGTERTVIAVIGDERVLPKDTLSALPEVERVMEVLQPYKLASKEGKKATLRERRELSFLHCYSRESCEPTT